MNSSKLSQRRPERPAVGKWLVLLLQTAAATVVFDAVLLLIAGRWDWSGMWVLTALYVALLLGYFAWAVRSAPDLLSEPSRMAGNVKGWDKLILSLYTLVLGALLLIAALDAGRFRWTSMPIALQGAGVLGFMLCALWIFWVLRTNSYLSRFARIQDDRGQQVVSHGPYRYVRHPMYSALIIFFPCVALILGSRWALLPAALLGIILVIRTALEDGMLQTELSGYAEYAQHVRYRLLPGLW